jgi:hypothetical protein
MLKNNCFTRISFSGTLGGYGAIRRPVARNHSGEKIDQTAKTPLESGADTPADLAGKTH